MTEGDIENQSLQSNGDVFHSTPYHDAVFSLRWLNVFYDAMMPSLLSNGNIFHDAVHSDTNLNPTILNLLHWDDDILNLQENNQDSNLKNTSMMTMWDS